MSGPVPTEANVDDVRDRSVRLFRFLYKVEKFRASRVYNVTAYGSTTPPGAVLWLGNLPDEPELRSVLHGTLGHDSETVLELDRIELPAPPPVPAALADRIDEPDSTDLDQPPTLWPDPQTGEIDDASREEFEEWLTRWKPWAQEINRVRPIRQLYRRMFRLYEQLDQHPEDLEALIAAGCLSWYPKNHAGVQRHLTVMPADVTFDAESGLITLQLLPTRECDLELDMLDPTKRPRPSLRKEVEDQLVQIHTSVLDPEAITGPLKTVTHGLSDEAVYDTEALTPHTVSPRAHVAFAPAFIVRKRTNERKLRVLEDIIAALEDQQQQIPDGVASIVAAIDLDQSEPQLDPNTDLDSAESYLPLPANRAQQEIVWSVEHRRHTVVQGPPGTGKTHTIANVLSHLLATGRRVLITAHTERALKEVRGMLPQSLRDLAIAVTGQSRDEKAALERSVRQMTSFVDDYQPAREHARIQQLETGLDELRREQARIRTELVQARVNDVETTTIGVYHGTPAEIAQQLSNHSEVHGWLTDPEPPQDSPLDVHACRRLLDLLRRPDLHERAEELSQPLPDLEELPTAEELAELICTAERAEHRAASAELHRQHPVHASFAALEDDRRRHFQAELRAVADDVRVLQARPEPWVGGLLRHLSAGKPGVWEQRAKHLEATLARCSNLLERLGTSTVRIDEAGDRDRLLAQAAELRDYLADGGSVRKLFNAKPVREASDLLEHVVVDGVEPKDLERVDAFIAYATLEREIDRADKLWPESMEIPPEDTFSERLAWHRTELDVLFQTLTTGKRLTDLHRELTQARLAHPDWADPEDIVKLADVAQEPDRQSAMEDARRPLMELVATLSSGRSGPVRRRLRDAVDDRDVASYQQTYELIQDLLELRQEKSERDHLLDSLRAALPDTARQLINDPSEQVWDQRLEGLADACAWAWTRRELRNRIQTDRTDRLMQQLDEVSTRLHQQVLDLTVARSWAHTVDRLDQQQRRRLNTYALLAKKLPKGGKYRARKLREVQDALRRCRDAVPAWIMPINYVAEVLDVDPNAFDVVIVDEASQAGMDATFLQYLAPNMIVIGDDLQVSPTAFVNRAEVHRLADELLFDFEDKPLWSDPENSLFDHASNKFGKRITLVEHFRCMPEIIGFSQRFIYEKNGVNLVPLRQYGAERLTPVRTLHVPDGYRIDKVNPPEVDAIVELIERCADDPAYEVCRGDGTIRKRTFGVISLTGSDQAKQIDQAIMDRLGEREYAERDVRCGDAADFQGSQREVLFLSLVEAQSEDGSRIRKRGHKATDQRVNVAASRAQDQMWLVHSVLPEHLHPEDIRYKLLTYCLGTERKFGSEQHAVPRRADENVLDTERFESLFEQHVFNEIINRGYAVRTQVPVSNYRIDLVVIGRESQIAVECDGDEFHAVDQYEADIARQRELERAGWTFFRVRGSRFYADRQGALEPLWGLLESHGIYPIAHEQPQEGVESVEPPSVSGSGDTPTENTLQQSENGAGLGDSARPGLDLTTVGPSTTGGVGNFGDVPGQERNERMAGEPDSAHAASPVDRAAISLENHGRGVSEGQLDGTQEIDSRLADLGAIYRSPASYHHWDTSTVLPDPNSAQSSERQEALRRIVEVEGPIVGTRLYQLYVKSSGGSKVGSAIRRKLNQATFLMERNGTLLGDDPLKEGGQVLKTFRLPDQPPFVVRERGERTIHEIPPLELAARLRGLQLPGDSAEDTFRRILTDYGLSNLTSKTRKRLEECAALLGRHGG